MRKLESREFPDGPVVGTQGFCFQAQVPSLVWKLRSYKLHSTAKKKKKKKERKKERKKEKSKKLKSRIHFLPWREISERSDSVFKSSVSNYGNNHLELQ